MIWITFLIISRFTTPVRKLGVRTKWNSITASLRAFKVVKLWFFPWFFCFYHYLPPLPHYHHHNFHNFLLFIYCNLLTDLFKILVKLGQKETISNLLIIPRVFPKMSSESSRKCYNSYIVVSEYFIIHYRKF